MNRDEQVRMLLHPEEYTDEQLAQMLDETGIEVPDAEEEWQRFKDERLVTRDRRSPVLKIAAMFAGVLLLSGIVYAAVLTFTSRPSTLNPPPSTLNPQSSTLHPQLEKRDTTLLKPVVFENAELQTVLTEIVSHYKYKVDYRNEATKHVRLYFTWDKTSEIEDVVATFNKFERISITIENQTLIVE